MTLSMPTEGIRDYICRQLNNFFPDNQVVNEIDITGSLKIALERLEFCFKHVSNTRYNNGGTVIYNHLYSDHNILLYWFLSNTIWKKGENKALASKLYYLNKALHGFDCMYDTKLPDIFLVFHGVGTMLGKATYSNYFVVMQGCTVGANNGKYPILGEGVSLTANSSIIGDCSVGRLCTAGTRALLFNRHLQDNETIFINKKTGLLEVISSKESYSKQFFKDYL